METILAIDPATATGVALITGGEFRVEAWDVAHEKPTKVRPDGTQLRKGEPKYFRLMKMWARLSLMHFESKFTKVVCEGAAGFQRGKSAVESSHKFRAVVELYCAMNDVEYVEIPPNDLKFFALGKRAGGKDEMIAAAVKMGYDGSDDNEADAYLIAKWYIHTQETLEKYK